jgi:chromosome segregation ATPase
MDENSYIDFTEPVVQKLESFADTLETLKYESEDWKTVISLFFLFIESRLGESNIYDYVYKTDQTKDDKLGLQEKKRVVFEEINSNITKLQELPEDINKMWDTINGYYDDMKVLEQEFKKVEEKFQQDIQEKYDQIKEVETSIDGVHKEMERLSGTNDGLYKNVESIDHKISDIENYIEESEWKVDLDSPEEKVFELIKNNLIILKKLKYGNI